jgi:WD40 repeat protein
VRADTRNITDFAFTPDGALLASASESSRHVKLWDVAGGRLAADLVAGDGGSLRIAFRPGGRTLAVAAERRADLYEISGPGVQATVAVQPHPVWAADIAPDGRSLACLANVEAEVWSNEVACWPVGGDAPTRPSLRARPAPSDGPRLVAVHPAGQGVVVSRGHIGQDGGLEFRSLTANQPPAPLRLALGDLKAVRFGPDGRLWVAAEYELWAYEVPGWRETAHWSDAFDDSRSTRVLYSVAPGAESVLVGRRNGQVLRFDPASRLLATWPVGDAPITALHQDEPSGLAVAGDERGRAWVLRVPSGEVVVDLRAAHRDAELQTAHRDGVDAAAVSPGGRLVVTGGRDRAVRLWRPDGTSVLTLRLGGPVAMLAFDPAGEQLYVLVAGERGVRRWHLGRLAERLREHGIDPGFGD